MILEHVFGFPKKSLKETFILYVGICFHLVVLIDMVYQ